jgi:dihydrofolate synthase/folylpolyglutamate synthase
MQPPPFSKYEDTLSFLFNQLPMYQKIGKVAYKKDLTNTLALSHEAGNPHDKIKTIHVAGTNGKGTVSHLIAFALQRQGYKVGLYTSPHYKDFRERIKINGKYVDKKYIVNFINKHSESIQKISPSFFELTVVMAFDYFHKENVDVAVIEVGLGGRLDSTNIINPLLSVITNISFDHTDMLGNTLELIAAEKAGIIKKNTPVIIGEYQKEIKSIFQKKAKEEKSNLYYSNDLIDLSLVKENNFINQYDINLKDHSFLFKTDLNSDFHFKNLITAFAAIKKLENFFYFDYNKIFKNFINFKDEIRYMGRWQVLQKKPLVILDSAHNEAGIKHAIEKLKKIKRNKLHIVLGVVRDKKLDDVMPILPKEAIYYFVNAKIPRALLAEELRQISLEYDLIGKSYKSVKIGYNAALKKANEKDIILIIGSIFVAAEVL